mgnify:FL=1
MIFDPLDFPYVRAATYTDGGAVVTASAFYNPVQDVIAALFGASTGISFSICTEEFETISPCTVTAGAAFGLQLQMQTTTNSEAASAAALAAGDHGIWRSQTVANGASDFIVRDGTNFVGTADSIWTARVRILARARLETVGNEGFVLGMGDVASGFPVFVAGSDDAHWQAIANGVQTDTGVAVVDDTWTWLIIARRAGTVYWYIATGAGALAQVHSQVFALSFTGCRRYSRWRDGAGGTAADYVLYDHFSRGIQR